MHTGELSCSWNLFWAFNYTEQQHWERQSYRHRARKQHRESWMALVLCEPWGKPQIQLWSVLSPQIKSPPLCASSKLWLLQGSSIFCAGEDSTRTNLHRSWGKVCTHIASSMYLRAFVSLLFLVTLLHSPLRSRYLNNIRRGLRGRFHTGCCLRLIWVLFEYSLIMSVLMAFRLHCVFRMLFACTRWLLSSPCSIRTSLFVARMTHRQTDCVGWAVLTVLAEQCARGTGTCTPADPAVGARSVIWALDGLRFADGSWQQDVDGGCVVRALPSKMTSYQMCFVRIQEMSNC